MMDLGETKYHSSCLSLLLAHCKLAQVRDAVFEVLLPPSVCKRVSVINLHMETLIFEGTTGAPTMLESSLNQR